MSSKNGFGNTYFLRSVHLSIVADDVWLWVRLHDRQGKHQRNKYCKGKVVAEGQRNALPWTNVKFLWQVSWMDVRLNIPYEQMYRSLKVSFPDPSVIVFFFFFMLWYILIVAHENGCGAWGKIRRNFNFMFILNDAIISLYYSIFHVYKIALVLWQNFKTVLPVVYLCPIGWGATLSFLNKYPIGGTKWQSGWRCCHLLIIHCTVSTASCSKNAPGR